MRRLLSVLCLFFFSLNGCSSPDSSESAKELESLPELSCVAVLPTAVPVSSSDTLTMTQKMDLKEGAAYLDSILTEELGSRTQFEILTENQLDAILGDPWGGRLQQVRTIGKATRCEAVLVTSLSKYRQRVGSTMSIETSAAAAFSMELISVEDGVVFWTTSFDETQKALFEDIFSYNKAEKRGFKWLTVEELSRDGMTSRLNEFPYFQEVDE